jgi:hypothetical protein
LYTPGLMSELVVAHTIQEALAAKPQAKGIRLSTETFTEPQMARLVYYSTNSDYPGQQDIADNTSDPERFGAIRKVKKWLAKGRTQAHFEPGGNDIHGLFWEGEEEFPVEFENIDDKNEPKTFINGFTRADAKKYGITYAARMYGRGLGKGLSTIGTAAIQDVFRQTGTYDDLSRNGQGREWLEVGNGNKFAIKSYERSGAVQVTEPYTVRDKYTKVPHEKINMVFPEFVPFGAPEPKLYVFQYVKPKEDLVVAK